MAGEYDVSGLQKWMDQEANPAAPAGQQQAAAAGVGAARGDQRYDSSSLARWMGSGPNPYTRQASSWYTGFNAEGTNNGWDNDFTRRAMEGQSKAIEEGRLDSYFSDPRATGVVTWDHTGTDGRRFRFGDIVDNGKVVGNVYELYDKTDADLSMTAWLFDGTEKRRIFSDSDVPSRLAHEVQAKREKFNTDAEQAAGAREFREDVKETQGDILEGGSKAALIAGGAAASGAAGATAGAALTSWAGPGAAVGAVAGGAIGAITGAIGAALNQDELSEQAARAIEITKLAEEQEGRLAGLAAGAQQAAQFSMRLSSPLTNITHGAIDAVGDSEVGDAKSDFYRFDDKTGRSNTPMWAQGLSLAATLADGVLQFATPVNRAIYLTQASTSVAGETGFLALSGGKMFDPREGGFDNIFVDDDGNFDPVSAAAGIMKVGIDAAQTAGWAGLSRAVGIEKRAAAAGAEPAELAGRRFFLDETGQLQQKLSWRAVLVPSEQVAAANASRAARVAAMKEGRAVTADDFYRAASDLATGTNKLRTAMVNAFAEGYEEGVQELLEPIALDGRIEPSDLVSAFMYGAAGGVGMSLGATLDRPSGEQQMARSAYTKHVTATGDTTSFSDWKATTWDKLSETERRVAASRTATDVALTRAAIDQIGREAAATLPASSVDAAAEVDAKSARRDKELAKAARRVDAYVVMTGQLSAGRVDADGNQVEGPHPEAVEASAATVFELLENRLVGLGQQVTFLRQRLADEQAAGSPAATETEADLRRARAAVAAGQRVLRDVEQAVDDIYDPATTEDQAEQMVAALNQMLADLYDARIPARPLKVDDELELSADEVVAARQQFVTQLHSREPKLSSDSYVTLLPQAAWDLTREDGSDMLRVSKDILQGLNGDFDGDKLRAENLLILSPERYAQARAGQLMLGAKLDESGNPTVDIGTMHFDDALTSALAESLAGAQGPQLRNSAKQTLKSIRRAITKRYGALMSPEAMQRVFTAFETTLHAGEGSARMVLVNALAREASEAITELGRSELRNEWLWISRVVRANLQQFQVGYRKHRAASAAAAPTAVVTPADVDTPEGTKNSRKTAAATMAQTLSLFAPGDSLFRMFQKIHYTHRNSKVLEQSNVEPSQLWEMAAFYEELSRLVTRSDLVIAVTGDPILDRVHAMLDAIVLDAMKDPALAGKLTLDTAKLILANVQVKNVWREGGEAVTDDTSLSLAQMLLKRAIEADRAEHVRTLAMDQELQAKHAKFEAMTRPNADGRLNAERAAYELFKGTSFLELMGSGTGSFVANTTPEQWMRDYLAHDETTRARYSKVFTEAPEYLDRAQTTNLPYTLTEAQSGTITPYRAMLDVMLAVGRSELTYNPNPKHARDAAGGERAAVSRRAMGAFLAAHAQIHEALQEFAAALGRTSAHRPSGAALVQRMFEENRAAATRLMALVPDAAKNALFEERDNELFVAPWIYEMFAIRDSSKALMFYWRNLEMTRWAATQAETSEDDGDTPGRQRSKIQTRFQRLLYDLAAQPGGLHMQQLVRQMTTVDDIDEFFLWLNTTAGFRAEGEPAFLPFNDDVADYDPQAAGGWVTARTSGDLQAALLDLAAVAPGLRERVRFRAERDQTDAQLLEQLIEARAEQKAGREPSPEGRDLLRRLERAVDTSVSVSQGFGPTAMLAWLRGVVNGFDAHSHDKGQTPTSYQAVGEFQALQGGYDFVPTFERALGNVTAYSTRGMATNLGDLAHDEVLGMDAYGRPVRTQQLTVDSALEMLSNPDARPLAYYLLSPTVREITESGQLTEKLLFEPHLSTLLDTSSYAELFRDDLDSSLRYLMMLDARAQRTGGDFSALRYAGALAIARTSSAKRELNVLDRQRIVDQAVIDTAKALRGIGAVQASPTARASGMLSVARDRGVAALRTAKRTDAGAVFTDPETGKVVDRWVEDVKLGLRESRAEATRALQERFRSQPATLSAQMDALEARYQASLARIDLLLEPDVLARLVGRYEITGDAVRDEAARARITEFARTQPSFGARAPEAASAWADLMDTLRDGRVPGDEIDWKKLSQAVINLTLSDSSVDTASHIALSGKEAAVEKFHDPAYTWLAEDLLDENSPLTAAAAWLHNLAGRGATLTDPTEFGRLMGSTVLDDKKLGPWTSGLRSQLTMTQQRLGSSSAPGGIAASGNGPKRWVWIAAATRRIRRGQPAPAEPPAGMLSRAAFPASMLSETTPLFSTITHDRVDGSVTGQSMHVAGLDNRFYAKIAVDGVELDLAADNLGFSWNGSTLRYVSLSRLRPVLGRIAAKRGTRLDQMQVEVEFVHPDSQPEGEEWMHSPFFDGMGHTLGPDASESLISTLESDTGGEIERTTQHPLDAGKLGLRAVQAYTVIPPAQVDQAEDAWYLRGAYAPAPGQSGLPDLAAVLRAKTKLVMEYDDGSGRLNPSHFNAVYKMIKLSHLVAGRDRTTAEPVALTAEQAIARLAAGDLGIDEPRLVRLSAEVLRTMLGSGGLGVRGRYVDVEDPFNPEDVEPYTKVTEQHLATFGEGWLSDPVGLGETELRNTAAERAARVNRSERPEEADVARARVVRQANQAADVGAHRHRKLDTDQLRAQYREVIELAASKIALEKSTLAFDSMGLQIAPRLDAVSDHTYRLLNALAEIRGRDSYERAWRVTDQGGADYPAGRLTVDSLTAKRPKEHRVVRGDIVVLDLGSFTAPERKIEQVQERVERAVDWAVSTGATVILETGAAVEELRSFAADQLLSRRMGQVAGSWHIFDPIEYIDGTQNQRAHQSTFTETRVFSPLHQTITFLADDPIGTDENDGVLNPESTKLSARVRLNNLLPSSTYAGFNIPLDDGLAGGLHARVLTHLRTVTDPANAEARAALLAQETAKPSRRVMTMEEALDRFHARISARSSLAPEVGDDMQVGDIIPFAHPDGKVFLYRHGMRLPLGTELDKLFVGNDLNVVIAASERESAATANDGQVVALDDRPGYGRSLGLVVRLQRLGDKVVQLLNGMKYTIAAEDGPLVPYLPGVPLLPNGTLIDIFSDRASADSKEAFEGRINNYRTALAFYGWDFLPDVTEFFFGAGQRDDPAAQTLAYNRLNALAKRSDIKIPTHIAPRLVGAGPALRMLLEDFAATQQAPDAAPETWLDQISAPDDSASAQIARAVLLYLLTPGAHVDNVLRGAGFVHSQAQLSSDVVTREVPGVFADLLTGPMDGPLHAELIRRFDERLNRTSRGAGYRLLHNWKVVVTDKKGATTQGYLQYGQTLSTGDNPVLNDQAFQLGEDTVASPHNAAAAWGSLGAVTVHKALEKTAAYTRSFKRGGGVAKTASGDSVWGMLTTLPGSKDPAASVARRDTPAQTMRRALARDEIVGFFRRLDIESPAAELIGWDDRTRAQYRRAVVKIASTLNLRPNQVHMVDTWVRQYLGRPYGTDDSGADLSLQPPSAVLEAAAEIQLNVNDRLLPTAGAQVPLIDVNHLTLLYLANRDLVDGWAPRETLAADSAQMSSWDGWVDAAFGTAWITEPGAEGPSRQFDSMYLLAVDGLMHGYQGATSKTRYLPVSADTLRDRQLMDPDTNAMLVSISADENAAAADASVFDTARADLDQILGGQRIYARDRAGANPESAEGRATQARLRWRREVGAPVPANTTVRGVRQEGQTFLTHSTNTHAIFRTLLNLRAGNTLMNVGLMVSAPLESFVQQSVSTATKLLTGDSTGALGRTGARLYEKIRDIPVGKRTLGDMAERAGLAPTWTTEQHAQLNDLVHALGQGSGSGPSFKAMVYRALAYQYPSEPGISRIEKATEKYAKFWGANQDPTRGMPAKNLARIYLEAVLRKLASQPVGGDAYSVETLIRGLARDPLWVKKNDLDAHNMGLNAIANTRMVKSNVFSKGLRGVVEPLAAHDNFVWNAAGNMLKMLTLFQEYWTNIAINISGMHAAADFMAFWLDGREKSKLNRRVMATLSGKPYDENADPEYYDMTDVLESYDLADAFIKGGVTHTALMAFGIVAGGLGLSGETEEEKYQRRAAEIQGGGYMRDPRALQNSFLNRDALYLDWLPFGLGAHFRTGDGEDARSLMQMNWITRTFLSPVLGMERFFNTGDFSEVLAGFSDAIGSHPLANEQLWGAAVATANELHTQANDDIEKGDPASGAGLLITAVSVLERMVMENAMINMIYVGADTYDRDPSKLLKTDSDGNVQVDITQNPVESDSLQDYVGDDGQVAQAYIERDQAGTTLRTLTENRFTLALVGSLFGGLTGEGWLTGSDLFRQNMAIKQREVERLPAELETLRAAVVGAYVSAMSQPGGAPVPRLTEAELMGALKAQVSAAGGWWNQADIEAKAAQLAEREPVQSFGIDVDEQRAALAKLRGTFASLEAREQLRDAWMAELKREGEEDLGLGKEAAVWRMRRIWFGDQTNSNAPSLQSLLFSNEVVPYSDTLRYNQLNTTYVTGPSGFPSASGFTRDGLAGALGLKPGNRLYTSEDTGMGTDSVQNSVDEVARVNTGMRALQRRGDNWETPSAEEQLIKAAEAAADKIAQTNTLGAELARATRRSGGYGGYSYGGRGGGGYSYGGGYSSGGYAQYSRMYAFARGSVPYGNDIPFINISNPNIRRADIRRERVWSERGRLNQWQ